MSWHAVRAVGDAAAAVREFFLPAERGRWVRLAALALVVGVGWLTPALARGWVPESVAPDGITGHLVAVGVGLLVLSGVVADVYGRFALLSGLRSGRLRLSEDVRWRLGRSVRWIGFTAASGLLVAAAAGVALRALRAGWLAVTGGDPGSTVGIAATVAVGAMAAVVGVGVVGFAHATLSLLPATMLATGVGALASWRRLWRAFAGYRGGFVGYLLVRGLVGLAVAVLALLAVGTLVAGLGVAAFVTLVGVFGTVSDAVATVGLAQFAALAALSVLVFAVLPVRAVALTYLVSYDLAVLGAVDGDLALLGSAGVDTLGEDEAVSVVLPDGTEAGPSATDGGVAATTAGETTTVEETTTAEGATTPEGEGTGAFQFGAVEADEE